MIVYLLNNKSFVNYNDWLDRPIVEILEMFEVMQDVLKIEQDAIRKAQEDAKRRE